MAPPAWRARGSADRAGAPLRRPGSSRATSPWARFPPAADPMLSRSPGPGKGKAVSRAPPTEGRRVPGLVRQQPGLELEPAPVTAQPPAALHDPVAGDQDG